MIRLMVLTAGPVALVGAAYALSYPSLKTGTRAAHAVQGFDRAGEQRTLVTDCALAARDLAGRLPPSFHLVVCPPFVLAGDLSEEELREMHSETVLPVTAALWRTFFDHKPDEPVTIIALHDEAGYRSTALSLDGYEPLVYAGYTQRGVRRIVCNLATGRGTLTHELAHVLASFDFPDMPEWFDEGLAALHEDAAISADGLTLWGTGNWRSRLLETALRQGELPDLESVITSTDFRGEGEGLHYAIVRTLCQYLQDRGLLSHFYRKFRGSVQDDPDGIATLCAILGVNDLSEVDRDFRDWVMRGGAR
jgi:hypothetical protein